MLSRLLFVAIIPVKQRNKSQKKKMTKKKNHTYACFVFSTHIVIFIEARCKYANLDFIIFFARYWFHATHVPSCFSLFFKATYFALVYYLLYYFLLLLLSHDPCVTFSIPGKSAGGATTTHTKPKTQEKKKEKKTADMEERWFKWPSRSSVTSFSRTLARTSLMFSSGRPGEILAQEGTKSWRRRRRKEKTKKLERVFNRCTWKKKTWEETKSAHLMGGGLHY